jgi:hypothetical protein
VLTRIAQPLRGSADHKYHAQAMKIAQPRSPAVSDWTNDSTAHMPMAQKNRNPKRPRNFILPPIPLCGVRLSCHSSSTQRNAPYGFSTSYSPSSF